MDRYAPINPKFPHFLHGGDYNPDQWFETPEILNEDIRLMKLAGVNTASVGIFSWVALEPEEGVYQFEWLDALLDRLAENGMNAILATPSGSKPAWLSRKYPEVRRVDAQGIREPHGGRHNHCRTSPVYRARAVAINTQLATRYKDHPALLLWHVSNEYNGEPCYCELCLDAFRKWLRRKYDGDLAKLNHEWWAGFWSHRFTDWEQIEPFDGSIHGLNLDWKRFISDQMLDFFQAEIVPLKEITPAVPVTTNFMGTYSGLDYWRFAKTLDVVSWDSYPRYHDRDDDWRVAVETSFTHDINRSMKGGKPFLLMESAPGVQNWQPVNKLKRPGMHRTEALQSVAHGSDSVLYFQWRKSRGGCEKFHGAVVDHAGHADTRLFREVAQLGQSLKKLDDVIGTTVKPEVAVIYDWENRWAIDQTVGPRNERKDYLPACVSYYRQFWRLGVPVDVINMDSDFSRYRLLVAPMLYMLRPGVAGRIEQFVKAGGTFVTTYWSGIVNENDLCFLGGFPGPLRKLLGIWAEETDVLYDDEKNLVEVVDPNPAGLSGVYEAGIFCDVIHVETAQVLAAYGSQFYAGSPAVTVNSVGKGQAYYVASRNDESFLQDFCTGQVASLGIRRSLRADLPEGVTVQMRTDGKRDYVFLLNFTRQAQTIALPDESLSDLETGQNLAGALTLDGYGSKILVRDATGA
jgi:beta-galactosidase